MTNLPERIWFSIGNGVPKYSLSYYKFLGATEFIRADLASAVGYSREQMIDALRHFIGPFRSIDIEGYMNSLTPAAQPKTQWIPTLHPDGTTMVRPEVLMDASQETLHQPDTTRRYIDRIKGGKHGS